jgi:hypothetical protein
MKIPAIKLIALWTAASIIFLLLFLTNSNTALSASSKMMLGLIIAWVMISGGIMYLLKDSIKQIVTKINLNWKIKFVIFATILALFEEIITTTLTNLAPVFGSTMAEAHITVSANYLDVVLFHSVIVLIPMFIAWIFLLQRYAFTPSQVFFLFGISGLGAELTLSPTAFTLFIAGGFWISVYGLMIYLPAYCTENHGRITPGIRHHIMAVLIPILAAIPVALIFSIIHPFKGFH